MAKTKTEGQAITPALRDKMAEALKNDKVSMKQFMEAFGMNLVQSEDAPAKETRIARREKYAIVKKLDAAAKKTITSIPKLFGSFEAPDEPRDLAPDEIDALAGELLPERESADIVAGRLEALRDVALNAITARNEGDPEAPGQLVSLEHRTKLVKSVTEPKAVVNYAALEQVVDEATWKAITVQSRVPDDDKIVKALADGKLSFDQVRQVTSLTKPVVRFLVQPLRKGDEIL